MRGLARWMDRLMGGRQEMDGLMDLSIDGSMVGRNNFAGCME